MNSRQSYASSKRRSVLSPVTAQIRNDSSTRSAQDLHSSPSVDSMRALSVVSDNPFFSEDSEFDLMHIKITVFGLTGIMVNTRDESSSKYKKESPRGSSSASTNSEEPSPLGEVPICAVVTFRRNATSSATSIASHLPSNPLENSMCSFGNSHRYAASWPAFNSSLLLDENEECTPFDQSSLVMERVMMREPYGSLSTFVHETVTLDISLKKGDEMIPIGVASIVISGDEDGPTTLYLPVQAIRLKGKKIVVADAMGTKVTKKKSRLFSKSATKPCFPSDKTIEFSLDENAALRVALQVVSQSTLKETEAAKLRRQQSEQRRLDQQKHRETILRMKYAEQLAMKMERLEEVQRNKKKKAPAGSTSMDQFFCYPSDFCNHDDDVGTSSSPATPKIAASTNSSSTGEISRKPLSSTSSSSSFLDSQDRADGDEQAYFHDDGSSVLSSVSESESESDDEPQRIKLKSITIRTRTSEKND